MTRLLLPFVAGAIVAACAAPAIAQDRVPHSVDRLEELSSPIPPKAPSISGILSGGLALPVDRRFDPGYHVLAGAGLELGAGFALGLAGAMCSWQAEATDALPEGEMYQFQGLVGGSFALPLGREGIRGPALRLSVFGGVTRGAVDLDRDDREALRKRDLKLKQGFWGGVIRPGLALDIPLVDVGKQRLALTLAAEYQVVFADARTRLRDSTGATPTIRRTDRLRLDALLVSIGLTARV